MLAAARAAVVLLLLLLSAAPALCGERTIWPATSGWASKWITIYNNAIGDMKVGATWQKQTCFGYVVFPIDQIDSSEITNAELKYYVAEDAVDDADPVIIARYHVPSAYTDTISLELTSNGSEAEQLVDSIVFGTPILSGPVTYDRTSGWKTATLASNIGIAKLKEEVAAGRTYFRVCFGRDGGVDGLATYAGCNDLNYHPTLHVVWASELAISGNSSEGYLKVKLGDGSYEDHEFDYSRRIAHNRWANVIAVAKPGYEFDRWSGDLEDFTTQNAAALMTDDCSATAHFKPVRRELKFSYITSRGTVQVKDSDGNWQPISPGVPREYDHGEIAYFRALVKEGYRFVRWEGDKESDDDASYTKMDADKNITAVFERITCVLTLRYDSAHGSVEVDDVPRDPGWHDTYYYGTAVDLDASAKPGYRFTGWSGDHTGTDASTTVAMDRDREVWANYEPDPPVADFVAAPEKGPKPLSVSFTDRSTGATRWSWDFGDGGTSTQQNPTHVYQTVGTYTVKLVASNDVESDDRVRSNYIEVTQEADTTAPTVVQATPTGNSVSTGASIQVVFSEAMNASSVLGAFDISPHVNCTGAGSGSTYTFAPASSLAAGQQCTVTIDTSAQDLAGNHLAQDYVWSFTTLPAADTTPPTVTQHSPTGNSVSTGASIQVVFSEAMNASSVLGAFHISPHVNCTGSASGSTYTFTPASSLAAGQQYTVTIDTSAQDLAGNHLAHDYVWQFTTASVADTTPPTVVQATPTGTGVSTGASIQVVFSEAMNASSVQNAAHIQPSVPWVMTGSGTTFTFTPSSALTAGQQYTVTIDTSAQDLAGNHLAHDYVWQFTTADSAEPHSWIHVVSGTLAGQSVSADDSEISVDPGSAIQGNVSVQVPGDRDADLGQSLELVLADREFIVAGASDARGHCESDCPGGAGDLLPGLRCASRGKRGVCGIRHELDRRPEQLE